MESFSGTTGHCVKVLPIFRLRHLVWIHLIRFLGRGMGSSLSIYLHRASQQAYIRAVSGIRTRDASGRQSGHCDQRMDSRDLQFISVTKTPTEAQSHAYSKCTWINRVLLHKAPKISLGLWKTVLLMVYPFEIKQNGNTLSRYSTSPCGTVLSGREIWRCEDVHVFDIEKA
jgi:hypothetical protein